MPANPHTRVPDAPAGSASSAVRSGGAPTLHLRADGISFSYPGRRILTDISLVVPAGRPTGLLGENGSGKSTLLRILAGDLTPDTGASAAPGPIGVLHQELSLDQSAPITAVVEDALDRSRRLERALIAAGEDLATGGAAPTGADPSGTNAGPDGSGADASGGVEPAPHLAQRYDDLLAEATLADVWNAERRAEEVLAVLGLSALDPATALGNISGGQRERLALAHLLIARPTTWLLDEPTNHLDDDGAAFLAAAIAAHPGPVLIASHDRAFLDDATIAQLDLDPAESPAATEPGGLTAFAGTFSDYLLSRFEARDRWEQRYRSEQEELTALRRAVADSATVGHVGAGPRTEARAAKKFYADRNATVVSRRLRESRAQLARLEQGQVRKPPAALHLTHLPEVPRGGQGGQVQLAVNAVEVAGRLAPTSFSLSSGQRLLITGENGSGKSTLLDVIAGQLAPTAGTVDRPRRLRIGHLGQDDVAIPGRSVGRHLRAAATGAGASDGRTAGVRLPESARSTDEATGGETVPELFGLVHPRDLGSDLTELSRGQLRRVMLAAVLLDPPELLVLDEPTNHLALVTATRLEAALQAWGGTVLIASHDRWLRSRWQGQVLDLGG